jgi:hypothetical protein
MSSALADRAELERGAVPHNPRHHSEHPFPSDISFSGTKRKPESHSGNSTPAPRQRPKPRTARDHGQRKGSSTNLRRPLEHADERPRLIEKADEGPRLTQKATTGQGLTQKANDGQRLIGNPTEHHRKRQPSLSIGDDRWRIDDTSDPDDDLEPPITKITSPQRIADRRNLARVERANISDQQLISKYLPRTVSDFLPNSIPGPDDIFTPGPDLMKAIRLVVDAPIKVPTAPPAWFDVSKEAVQHNSGLLEACDFDLTKFLASHQDSTLAFGSEFRPVEQLRTILGGHPNFAFFTDVLASGMEFHFSHQLSEDQRLAELDEMVSRGNHKSAEENGTEVERLLSKDVHHGFSLPVDPSIVRKLKGAMVQPAGLALQFALLEDGSRVPKRRLTQDSTFALTFAEASVNERIDMDAYPEMIYGWCLSRIIHFIVALRLKHPTKKIFIAKYDYSDAYRRIAHSATAAVQSIIIFAGIAYIALRLTFGGSPNPPTWCAFSEMVTDLSNEIPLCDDWDPSQLRSPAQPVTPTPLELPASEPLALAKPMAVIIPTSVTGRTDSFIDDLIRVFLDTPKNRDREPHAVPLAIHVTSRPHMGPAEPVTRRGLLSDPKLIAEGTPAEIQVVLGWDLNTRSLTILLPFDKFEAWTSDLNSIVETGKTTFGELESTVGRLNHAGYVIPLSRHFLNRLRLRITNRRPKNQQLTLTKDELRDLRLWLEFLQQARSGISLNCITTRQPSKLGWSDSCPFGLGGFLLSGRAWRIQIPPLSPIFGVDIANNVLEFLAMLVTIWLTILECNAHDSIQDCILAMGDNTSAIGWLHKSGRLKPGSAYYAPVQFIARQVARLLLRSSHCLASQHIKGDNNVVSDLLSFAGNVRGYNHPLALDNPSDATLTQRFHDHIPQLIPAGFVISPLPSEISSFVIQALQMTESSLSQSRKSPTKNATAPGVDTPPSAPSQGFTMTPSSLDYPNQSGNSSSEPFLPSTGSLTGTSQEAFLASVRAPWFLRLSEMPQATWLRRFGVISNQVPFTSKEAPSYSPPSGLF